MSRSKKDILDTEAMLHRLTALLSHNHPNALERDPYAAKARADAESLRRISMTLHRWFELECGDSNDHQSWCITRGNWVKADPRRAPRQPDGSRWPREFAHDDNGKPFMEIHYHDRHPVYSRLNDREAGARKRLAAILKRYPALTAYVQTDPRGCALYILKLGDVPPIKEHFAAPGEFTVDGGPLCYPSRQAALEAAVSSYYSRGLAVHQ